MSQSNHRILILAGTTEATALASKAQRLPTLDIQVSLAGRTQSPVIIPGNVRVGGFGGVNGLKDYLLQEKISAIVDATHPFAAQMSWHAAQAAGTLGIPCLRLDRPCWEKGPDDHWLEVENLALARQRLMTQLPEAKRIFLSIGRQEIAHFTQMSLKWCLMRMIDAPLPQDAIPDGEVLLARGPFDLAQELALLQKYQIDAIVSKNSGGTATYAKVIAARELNIPIVMINRPALPSGAQVTTVIEALSWLEQFA